MDSVNKKLEEDYQQLFILLKKKYKKEFAYYKFLVIVLRIVLSR